MPKLRPEEIITSYFLDNFKNNILPWRIPYNPAGIHSINFPFRHINVPYRGINVLILIVSSIRNNYTSPFWLTYRQALDIGGNLKGEKGTRVLYYGQYEDKNSKNDDEPNLIKFAKTYSVFNLQQATDLPEDYLKSRMVAEAPTHPIHDYIAATGANILNGNDQASYYPGVDTIRMPNQNEYVNDDTYAAELAHELIHWSGHKSRLNRDSLYAEKDTSDSAYEEIIAEVGAVMLCARFNIPTNNSENHLPYIAHWMEQMQSNPKYITKAAADAEKAVSYILNSIPTVSNADVQNLEVA